MDDPITEWMEKLQRGCPHSAQKIWEHYCSQLYAVARTRLSIAGKRVYDEEDAALSAFHSLCRGIQQKRFPELTDRDNLWRLLLTITLRKISVRRRYDHQDRRDIHRLEMTGLGHAIDDAAVGPDGLPDAAPPPEFLAEISENCERLFNKLSSEELRRIAELKMEGYTNGEIASRLSVTRRTIERKVERIRREWSQEAGEIISTVDE